MIRASKSLPPRLRRSRGQLLSITKRELSETRQEQCSCRPPGAVARLPCDCAWVVPETAHRSVQWRFASQLHLGLAFIQPPRYFLSPTAPPLRGLEDDQPVVFLAVRKGRLADCAKQ